MAYKKILTLIIVLVTAISLQSQNARVDTSAISVAKPDSSGIEKMIDSINTDTYRTAIRVQRKASRLVSLTQQSRMQQVLQSRIKLDVSEIPVKELPVVVDSVKVDPPQVPVKHKFKFWRR